MSHGCPAALFGGVNVLNTRSGGGPMSTQPTPQEIVERALASSTSPRCIVIVRSRSVANLRWARNTLTTNGETVGGRPSR